MAKNYEVGKDYYLPVTVNEIYMGNYPVVLEFSGSNERDTTDTLSVADEPDLLLTAYEISSKFRRAKEDERIAELEKQNNELEKQNNDLTIQVTALMAEREQLKSSLVEAQRDIDERSRRYADYASEKQATIYRKTMIIDILIDKIAELEAALNEERKKNG